MRQIIRAVTRTIILQTMILPLLFGSVFAAEQPIQNPNIVLILADDPGYK